MRFRLRADKLTEILAASSLSQNHWALKIGLSRGHWSEIVNGKHPYPSPQTRARMVEAFGVPVELLFVAEAAAPPWEDVDFRRAIADRYIIDSEVGQGGMGAVYLARDVRHGRTVAVKVIAAEIVSGIGIRQFQREISTVAKLIHPNILPLFDSGEAAGQPYFVMPYMREGSLRARIRKQTRLGLTEVVRLTTGIARALHHAHSEHVLHCDVKPENVVLFEDHPFVTDFGIARVLRTEVGEWSLRNELDLSAGTPAYVSPEQAAGDRNLDARSDVYSLACLTFEMLSGRPPFEGTSTEAIVSRRFIVPPPPIREFAPEVPLEVSSVLERAMSLPREQRHPTVAAFAAELRTAAAKRSRIISSASLAASRTIGAARRAANLQPEHRLGRFAIDFITDVRGAWRTIRRAPVFSLTVILTLGIALGVNATMFGIIDHLLLRAPAHIVDPDRIVGFHSHRLGAKEFQTAQPYVIYKDLLRDVKEFENVAVVDLSSFPIGRGADAIVAKGQQVSPSYFPLLGVRPFRGRFFQEGEAGENNPQKLAVISYDFWRQRFGGDDGAIGQTIDLGTDRYTIVGVTPKGFTGTELGEVNIWIPIAAADGLRFARGADWSTTRTSQWLMIYARLKPGIAVERANAAATQVFRAGERLRVAESKSRDEVNPDSVEARLSSIIPGRSIRTSGLGAATPEIRVAKLLGIVAVIVFLIACANVTNLFLTRAIKRRREVALRIALGISQVRLVRQLFLEGVLLSALSAAAALICASFASGILGRSLAGESTWTSTPVDLRMFAFTCGASFVAAIATSLLPALRSGNANLTSSLKAGAREGGGAHSRTRSLLLASQASLAVILLIGAGLFVRSLQNVAALSIGVDVNHILAANANHNSVGMSNADAREMFRQFIDRSRSVPGVTGAATAIGYSFGLGWGVKVVRPGRDAPPKLNDPSQYAVTTEYFDVMGIRLLQGRKFNDNDRAGTELVTIISQTAAKTFFPGENALGQCLKLGGDTVPCTTVVGIVSDARRQELVEDPVAQFYRPLDQLPTSLTDRVVGFFGYSMIARTSGSPASVAEPLRKVLQSSYPGAPYISVFPLADQISDKTRSWTLGAMMFTIFGVLALALAIVGLYGVVAFNVAERRHEFGVRVALGATNANLVSLTLLRGVAPAAIGVAIGSVVAWIASLQIQNLLFQLSPRDPFVFVGVITVLMCAAVVASLVPAWRLRCVEPMSALRSD